MYREIADSDMAAGIRFASNELEARELTTPCSYDRLSNDSEWQFRAGTRLGLGVEGVVEHRIRCQDFDLGEMKSTNLVFYLLLQQKIEKKELNYSKVEIG